jgi:hypothetical protein
MPGRIRGHLRSNVVAYLALFFALSGTAVALDGSNTVFSDDIVNGEVSSPDVKDGSLGAVDIREASIGTNKIRDNDVRTGDILDETIQGADIQNAPPFGSGGLNGDVEIIDGTVSSFDIGASQVSGFHVANDTLEGADIDESSINLTTAATSGSCTDDGEDGDVCASTTITLGEAGKVLANASGEWHTFVLDDTTGTGSGTDDTIGARGSCVLQLDGSNIGSVTPMGERSGDAPTANHPTNFGGTLALTGLSGTVAAGVHTVQVFCTELDGDLDWSAISLTAQGSAG